MHGTTNIKFHAAVVPLFFDIAEHQNVMMLSTEYHRKFIFTKLKIMIDSQLKFIVSIYYSLQNASAYLAASVNTKIYKIFGRLIATWSL